ncbi:hypothetical protein FEP90_05652 [Burkholderia multivorans]|nr:hypothetical protein [Burkholderia multivorans]
MPSATPSAIASDTPIIEIPSSRLLQSFAIWPVPVPPQWTTCLPIASSTGRICSNSAGSAPTMNVSVPACAPPVPPDTGASASRQSRCAAASASVRTVSGSIVLQSISHALPRAPASTPFSPS